MRGAMLWITRRLSRRSGGEYGAHNHQFITMKQKEWYSFAMLDFGSRCSSAINRSYSRCHHSFAATQASDEEARNGGGHITICRRGERHTYPLTIEMQVQGKHLVLTSQHPSKSGLLAMAYHIGETDRARDHHQQVFRHNTQASEMFRQSYMIHCY